MSDLVGKQIVGFLMQQLILHYKVFVHCLFFLSFEYIFKIKSVYMCIYMYIHGIYMTS